MGVSGEWGGGHQDEIKTSQRFLRLTVPPRREKGKPANAHVNGLKEKGETLQQGFSCSRTKKPCDSLQMGGAVDSPTTTLREAQLKH